ncbi:MAG TPA: DinB family protein [Anaerolineales bacterium]
MDIKPETTLIELILYNNWANAKVLAACQELTADQMAATAPGTYGSIRNTLGHIIRAEADYVGRMTGERPQPAFEWKDEPDLADVATFAAQVGETLLDTVQRIPPTYLVHEEEDGETLDYHARLLFIQVINHGIEHRTNITTIISGLGLTAPEVDGWGYLSSHPDRFAMKSGRL